MVKRPTVVLSRDPFNVSGKNTKTSSGLANEKAFGITQKDGKITVISKSTKNQNKPVKNIISRTYPQYKSSRKTALAVSNLAKGYRDDLRAVAVKRVSQYTRSRNVKKTYATSVRGKK